jgi:hypothetical protein
MTGASSARATIVVVKMAPARKVGLWSARDLTEGRRPTSCSGSINPTGGVIAALT